MEGKAVNIALTVRVAMGATRVILVLQMEIILNILYR